MNMRMRMRLSKSPERPMALKMHDRVKFHSDRFWFDVVGVSKNFVVLTRPTPFQPGVLTYTIIDWRNGWRGPHNSWGYGIEPDTLFEDAWDILQALEFDDENDPARLAALAAGEKSWVPTIDSIELSQRYNSYIDIDVVQRDKQRITAGIYEDAHIQHEENVFA